jgi:hypothetical protein
MNMDYRKYPHRTPLFIITSPFIYAVFLPVLLLDLFIEIYHHICFPAYGLPLVKRSDYIVFDRAKLSYLTWYEKINCEYCGYVNGFLAYAVEIAAQTEKYWCGIRHQARMGFHEPAHEKNFLAYGDEEAYRKIKPEEEPDPITENQ